MPELDWRLRRREVKPLLVGRLVTGRTRAGSVRVLNGSAHQEPVNLAALTGLARPVCLFSLGPVGTRLARKQFFFLFFSKPVEDSRLLFLFFLEVVNRFQRAQHAQLVNLRVWCVGLFKYVY